MALREPTTPPDKVVDQIMEVKITAATDTPENFDLSRADYISKLSPEERKAIEETKAKNASAMKDNAVIKNLNANLVKARQDITDKNYTEADSLMTQATQAKPDAAVRCGSRASAPPRTEREEVRRRYYLAEKGT